MTSPTENRSAEPQMSRAEQNRARLRAYQHLFMGFLYLVIGGIVMYKQYFGSFDLSGGMAYFLGGLFLVYGLFRMWRGGVELNALRRMR